MRTYAFRKAGRWVALVALTGLAGLPGIGFGQVLSVPQKYQEKDQWCWAGCSQAILAYYGRSVTQTTIAQYGTGGANVWNYCYGDGTDGGIYRRGINLIRNHFGSIQSATYNTSISQATVQNEMAGRRPVVVNWYWDSGGGHFVVLRGLSGNTAYLMDPWNGPTVNTFAWTQRGGGHTWRYSLRLTTSPPAAGDAYEPDNSQTAARRISDGQTQRRSIHAAGNEDWVKFTLSSARKVLLRTGSRSGYAGGDTEMWVYGPNGGRLVNGGYCDDYGGTRWSRFIGYCLRSGTYYVRIREHGNNGRIPGYTLFLDLMAPTVVEDRYEPDNGPYTAKTLVAGRSQARTIHRAGNEDFAKFTLSRRSRVVVTTGALQGYVGGDTQVWIYRWGGASPLAGNDDYGGTRWSRVVVSSLAAGTYVVRVRERGNNGQIPGYKLSLSVQ